MGGAFSPYVSEGMGGGGGHAQGGVQVWVGGAGACQVCIRTCRKDELLEKD